MTEQDKILKTIRHMEFIRKQAQISLDDCYERYEREDECASVYHHRIMYANTSIEALEKQIPKKPLEYDDCEYFNIKCTCGNTMDTRRFHGYCTWCGQKLDWGDAE